MYGNTKLKIKPSHIDHVHTYRVFYCNVICNMLFFILGNILGPSNLALDF